MTSLLGVPGQAQDFCQIDHEGVGSSAKMVTSSLIHFGDYLVIRSLFINDRLEMAPTGSLSSSSNLHSLRDSRWSQSSYEKILFTSDWLLSLLVLLTSSIFPCYLLII
jgi:hypothetical protein